jgi:ABC-type polar amino acid transport system ATPase subunit
MKRILREKQSPNASKRKQVIRLKENVAQVQQRFNEFMEQMAMAEIALAQLEVGVDHIDVKMWPHAQDDDERAGT